MEEFEDKRPDPELLLQDIRSSEQTKRGKLKIFFGYAAGVGKTYAMLDDAHEQLRGGVDVLVGYIEPHTRPETVQQLVGLPTLNPKIVQHRNIQLKEFDLDAALARKPELILVDELAHSNAKGVRNRKRYQDIEELLNAGIDVYTTVNVQHIESLNNVVQDITRVQVRETIPDYIFDNADMVNLIDIEPDELLMRFEEGKIYRPERAQIAMNNFFTRENLRLLREIAMRKAADRLSHDNQSERRMSKKMANIKFLACVGISPSSAKCIRWTARTADAFHAPWIVLHVETPESLCFTEKQQKIIRNNLELAEQLGAEIVTVSGDSVAESVAHYARLTGITNIVMGKGTSRRSLRHYFKKDLADSLICLLPNVEIHIISDSANSGTGGKTAKINFENRLTFSWGDTLKTIGILGISTVLSLLLCAMHISNQNVIMIYILSVIVISRVTSGYAYGVIASIMSVLTFDLLFIEPQLTLNAIQKEYPITFLIMLLVALITSALTVRIKTQERFAVEKERRTEVLYEINKKLLATRGLEKIIILTNEYIEKLFNRSVIFYTKDPVNGICGVLKQSPDDSDASFMLAPDEEAVAHWVFVNQKRAGAGTDTLMGAGAFYMPVSSQGNVLGVLGISCSDGRLLNQNTRSFLRMIASQVAMALERQYLSDEQRSILIESEKEKMRSNLLRAISHDLRTPLTGILGAGSTILERGDSLSKETRDQLASGIKEDAQWLIRLVENLLSVTRINEGTMNVTKTPEAAEEIIAEAISRIRKRFKDRKITVKVPDELLLVPMDGTLIEQVIINLVENAVKHSGEDSTIEVLLKKSGRLAVFEVSDNGEGISEQELPYLFDSYVPNGKRSSDSSRGMGIGLSICMSIIKAHGGKLEARNKKGGGAVFSFSLPLEEGDGNES
jgi:two-component system sensor histidine kinase KdpD